MQRGRLRKPLIRIATWAAMVGAFGWALSQAPLSGMLDALRRLRWIEIGALLVANIIVFVVLSGRWWVLLRGLGHPMRWVDVIRYRLAGFAVSYFTPGPQFGGEPLQVLLLRNRHGVPARIGSASVALDKAIELLGNFAFLVFGIMVLFWLQVLPGRGGLWIIAAAILLLILPILLMWAWWLGKRPITGALDVADRFLGKLSPGLSAFTKLSAQVESEMVHVIGREPRSIAASFVYTALSWAALVGEYYLMTLFLELALSPAESIAALTAARLAFLTPLPGGLGALEAGQVAALSVLGHTPAVGLSLSLLIRARDLAFSAVGLLSGGSALTRKRSDPDELLQDLRKSSPH
jgi:hypothetical protein